MLEVRGHDLLYWRSDFQWRPWLNKALGMTASRSRLCSPVGWTAAHPWRSTCIRRKLRGLTTSLCRCQTPSTSAPSACSSFETLSRQSVDTGSVNTALLNGSGKIVVIKTHTPHTHLYTHTQGCRTGKYLTNLLRSRGYCRPGSNIYGHPYWV